MQISLLGPVEVASDDASPIDIPGARLRMLLARLALEAGRPVSADSLIDDIWGEEPPTRVVNALHGLISRLRRTLGGPESVELVAGGYRLPLRHEDVDAHRFEQLAGQARRELAADRPREASSLFRAALEQWRGAALADVLEASFARNVAARLEELRATVAEDFFDAEVRLGRHTEVLTDLASAAVARPLSERLAELRIRALSAAGRHSEALAVYEEVRGKLGDELGMDPSPELRAVHLALLRGELNRPSVRPQAAPSRLPARLTSFVGRERELGELARLMAGARLVTIVGPGGAGKTRLALEAADHLGERTWFVSLAGATQPDQIADAVLSACGGLFEGGFKPQAPAPARLAAQLDVGPAVLVLDNCEHLVEAAARLADQLLVRLPQLRILATSREALAINGEVLCHLGPLDLPVEDADLAEAAESAAVRLFVERAADVRQGFALDRTTLEPAVEICRRLDGMPLALELAAAKLRAMSVVQIVRRLDDRFRLLTSGSRTALPRQRTLLAMVEWSWDLLEEPERVLAARLAAFPGGADLAALEAICSDASLTADDMAYVAGALVEKSMIQQVGDRYRMLETIRAYAAAQLAEPIDDRFRAYFLALAEENEPLLRTGDQLRAIEVFDAEHDNLVAVLRAAIEAGDAATAARLVRSMIWYWGMRGMSTQSDAFLSEVLAFGDMLPADARTALEVVRSTSGRGGGQGIREDLRRPGVTKFHNALPLLRISKLATQDAQDLEALDSPDPWVRASAHWAYDFLLTEQGDQETGARHREEALRLFEQVGDRWGLVMSLVRQSRVHGLRGEHERAVAACERAVAIASELGTEEHLFITKSHLAQNRMRGGDLDGALHDIHAARRQGREHGHRRLEASMLFPLAEVHRHAGDLELAHQVVDELETVVHRLPGPPELNSDVIVSSRMAVLMAEGAAERARELLPRAMRGVLGHTNANAMARGAELLARLLGLEGDPAGAATALGMSHVIRGVFDEGDLDLRRLVPVLAGRLGDEGYLEAYRRGASLPRQEAMDRLTTHLGR
ncbi:BTAD domain-containing putative transcriptional regulator [Nonomuraea aridisoli]|uniref:AfsR family transcriptional regulator n=1 Tax=Nonomuraea aridisoli TaxID=2070368 RepID=A0A2W2EVT8_9ACTN|nr:BTAD domain-containing putative transcriptional regulator [Nonomuraea aridisoli]PZG20939.1 AfsR family transcriptional regulator [Nonomuraea aridisoli]